MSFNLNRKIIGIAAAALVLPVAVSCAQETAQAPVEDPNAQTSPDATTAPNTAPNTTASGNVVSVVASNPDLSTLATAIADAGLGESLSSGGPYTIFAPSNEAFAALPEATRQRLLQPEGRDELRQLLSYHVVPSELTSNQLGSGQVQSLEGTPLTIDVNQAQVRVNNATVAQADIPATNGVIHVVDQVILPPNVSLK